VFPKGSALPYTFIKGYEIYSDTINCYNGSEFFGDPIQRKRILTMLSKQSNSKQFPYPLKRESKIHPKTWRRYT